MDCIRTCYLRLALYLPRQAVWTSAGVSSSLLYPLLNEVYWFRLVRLSIRLSVCPSVDIVSTLYLLQYSPDPFRIYTSYQATSEGVSHVKKFKLKNFKFWQILYICNIDFVLFWLGTQYELLNNMGNHGGGGIRRQVFQLLLVSAVVCRLYHSIT